jgi:hypothetical protein
MLINASTVSYFDLGSSIHFRICSSKILEVLHKFAIEQLLLILFIIFTFGFKKIKKVVRE